MSQNVSAFAVYKLNRKKNNTAAKRKNNAKNAKVNGKNKKGTKNVAKVKNATKVKQIAATKQNAKKKYNGTQNGNLDNLVERLKKNSKSKKFTEEELLQKKILERLYDQGEEKMSDSEDYDDSEVCCGVGDSDDSEEGTTDESSFLSEFSSEFTLNSSSDEDNSDSGSDGSEHDDEVVVGAEPFSLEALGVQKTTPNKRKTDENGNERLKANDVFSLEAIGAQKTTPKRKTNERLEVNGSEALNLETNSVNKKTANKAATKRDASGNGSLQLTVEETFRLDALGLRKRSPNKRKSAEPENAVISQKQTKITVSGPASNNSKQANVAATATARRNTVAATNAKPSAAATKNQRRSLNVLTTASSVSNKSPVATKADVISNVVKLEGLSPPSNVNKVSSIDEGLRMFRWMLNPVNDKEFFNKYWEKNCCLIKREQTDYYSHLISFEAIDKMLLNHHLEFTKNIDITSYKKGVRETLNPEGRALPPHVWDQYGQGCSIRILNPQTFLQPIFTMNSTLQEYFHCMVGANVYLTPPNSQGFAPHYDDIEAFVLQIEGRKRWRLYKPRNQAEMLPRVSSRNFTQLEIGKPILDEVLKPGDMLYFPRGTIHQACTEPGFHSLHITVSVYQKQSFADLFEHMLPQILKRAVAKDVNLRQGLPLDTFRQAGIAYSATDTKERANLVDKISKLLTKTLKTVNIPEVVDAAVDEMAKRFQHEALPPHLMFSERSRTIFGSRSIVNEQGECICDYEFDLRTNIRLIRAHILRLVREDDKICLYFYAHNSQEYQEFEPNFIEINAEEASCVEVLVRSYPAYIGVSELPVADENQKIGFAQALWERGLLMLEKSLS